MFLFDFVFLCLLVSHQCIIHSRYGNQLRSGIRYWVLAILAILVLVLGIGKFVSSSLVLISVKGALASQHFLRAEGGGVVVKGVVCVRFSGCLPYHTVLELRNLEIIRLSLTTTDLTTDLDASFSDILLYLVKFFPDFIQGWHMNQYRPIVSGEVKILVCELGESGQMVLVFRCINAYSSK